MKTFASMKFEKLQIEKLSTNKKIPTIAPGMQVKVAVLLKDGNSTRTQYYEGVCVSVCKKGIASSITVRKLSSGKFGVDRIFKIYSPSIASIEIVRHGIVRRAKLYYLSDRVGKSAKLKEDFLAKAADQASEQ